MKNNINTINKSGLTTVNLAKNILKYNVGDRIPTITEWADLLQVARGTVHGALTNLEQCKAIEIESKGYMGNYLKARNVKLLLSFIGVGSLIGCVPIPRDRYYIGLCKGLIQSLKKGAEIPTNLVYMLGAHNRCEMLAESRYDFTIVSRFAANKLLKEYDELMELIDFGPQSLSLTNSIVFAHDDVKEIKDGMRVGIDRTSFDQVRLIEKLCADKKVELVDVEYGELISKILAKEIDATAMNHEDAKINGKLNIIDMDVIDESETTAVLLINKENEEWAGMLKSFIDVEEVLKVQKEVVESISELDFEV